MSGIFIQRDVEMLALDHDVLVLHLAHPSKFTHEKEPRNAREFGLLRIPYDPRSPQSILSAARRVRRLVRGADVLHTMVQNSLLPAFLAGTRRPWLHTEHSSGVQGLKSAELRSVRVRRAVYSGIHNPLLRCPDQVVTVSDSLRSAVRRWRSGSTTVIPNHVRFPSQNYGVPAKTPTVQSMELIAVGGLTAHKGVMETIQAVAELRRRGADARLTWVGDGVEMRSAQELSEGLGMTTAVTFPGFLPPEELSERLMGADVLVLATRGETFGLAAAEALSHGVPVVATGTGGHLEFLPRDGSRIVTERSASAIADAVEDLLRDPNRMSRSDLQRYARSRFDRHARREAYSKLISGLLGGNALGAS